MSISEQDSYIQGQEDMYNTLKAIYELTFDEREKRFGETAISYILDKFDFHEVYEKMNNPIEVKYIIRGIKVNDYNQKRVVVESEPLTIKPDEMLVNAFLNCHKDKNIKFATVEEIYIKENR